MVEIVGLQCVRCGADYGADHLPTTATHAARRPRAISWLPTPTTCEWRDASPAPMRHAGFGATGTYYRLRQQRR